MAVDYLPLVQLPPKSLSLYGLCSFALDQKESQEGRQSARS